MRLPWVGGQKGKPTQKGLRIRGERWRNPFRVCVVERFEFSVGEIPIRQLLFQPEAAEARVEARKPSKPLVSTGRESGSANGRAATCSERQAGSENGSCRSRPTTLMGKAAAGKHANNTLPGPAGVIDGGTSERKLKQPREVHGDGERPPIGNPRGPGRVAGDGGEVRSRDEAGQLRGSEGTSVRRSASDRASTGDWR